MKILLIAPPFTRKKGTELETYPPLGIMQLSSYLKQNKHVTKILDLSHEVNYRNILYKNLKEFRPEVVGISSIIASHRNSLKVAKIVKAYDKQTKVVLGGIYPTFGDTKILSKTDTIDVIVRGEGELTANELLTTWENNGNLKDVAGISYKKDNKIYRTKDRELIKDLNLLPALIYNELETINYYQKKSKFLMVTSRGCPYKCTFCSTSNYWRHIWRAKSSGRVVNEFKQLVKLGAKNILVGDDLFILDKKRVIDICRGIIESKLKIKWRCSCRANLVDIELLKWLKTAGCDSIFIGGESGNQKTLDRIDKHQKVGEIIKVRKWCSQVGIDLVISFIMGFPWETKKEIRDTISLAKKIGAEETVWFIYHKDIGSPLYKTEEQKNKKIKYDPDKCLDSIGSNTRTEFVTTKELEGLYLEAILATS